MSLQRMLVVAAEVAPPEAPEEGEKQSVVEQFQQQTKSPFLTGAKIWARL
jgi:hypothetical protein